MLKRPDEVPPVELDTGREQLGIRLFGMFPQHCRGLGAGTRQVRQSDVRVYADRGKRQLKVARWVQTLGFSKRFIWSSQPQQ